MTNSTSATPRKRAPSSKAKPAAKTKPPAKAKPPSKAKPKTAKAASPSTRKEQRAPTPRRSGEPRTITIKVPRLDRAMSKTAGAAMLPVAVARQVLPAKGGLPLYLGLGVLGAADVLDWPVAIGIGIGYAILRPERGTSAASSTTRPASA